MIAVSGEAVAEYLGRGDDEELVTLASGHALIVTEWVKSYTRGVGFDAFDEPAAPIAAVIIAATARLSNNPDGIITLSIDDYSVRNTVFEGFTLIERLILDGYRRKAA